MSSEYGSAAVSEQALDRSRSPARHLQRGMLLICVGLFVLNLGVRLGWQVHQHGPNLMVDSRLLYADEVEYDLLARNILSGVGYRQTGRTQGAFVEVAEGGKATAFRTPGLPAIVAAIYWVAGASVLACRVVLLLLTSLIAPASYLLGLTLFGRRVVALGAACAWAVAPSSLLLAPALLGEEISALLLVVAILLVVADRKRQNFRTPRASYGLVAVAGFLLGLATLTRGCLVFVPVVLGGWLVLQSQRRLAAVLLLTAAILPAAWVARNAVTMGVATLSTEGPQVIWLGNNRWARGSWSGSPTAIAEQRSELRSRHPDFEKLDEVALSSLFSTESWRLVREDPGHLFWLVPRKVALFFHPKSWMGVDWLLAAALPFFVLGLLELGRRRDPDHTFFLLTSIIVSVLVVCLLTFSDPRFRHAVEPLIFVTAAFGVDGIVQRVRACLSGRSWPSASRA